MTDWSNWQPGWPGAASSVEAYGVDRIDSVAEAIGVPISDLVPQDKTSLVRLLAEALSAGWSTRMLEKELRPLLGDRPRARSTANTLLAWAMCTESLAGYEANKLEVEWLAVGDACYDCSVNKSAGAIEAGRAFPPGHLCPPAQPECRCALAPTRPFQSH
jgi:hypothetical protein